MVSKIATLKDRNGNKLLPRTVFEAVQSNSGNTLDSALNDKLDKIDVVNTNTETVLGKALDATQNNPNVDGSLAKQIGVLPTLKTTNKEDLVGAINENVDYVKCLNNELGIPYATWLDNPDFNTLTTYNRYRIGGGTHSPDNNSVWYLEVNPIQDGIIYQRAKCIYGGSLGKKCDRVLRDGSWTDWICNDDEITALRENCIYLNGAINLDNVIKKGEYFINSTTELIAGTGITNAYLKVYVSNATGHLVQKIIRHNQNDGFYIAYRQQVGSWQRWNPIATTDKIDISCTPETGYAIEVQNNYLINNVVYYNLDVKRIDGSDIPINQQISVAIMPEGMSPKYWVYGYGGTRNNGVTGEPATIAFYSDRKIYATCKSNGKILGISGVIVL